MANGGGGSGMYNGGNNKSSRKGQKRPSGVGGGGGGGYASGRDIPSSLHSRRLESLQGNTGVSTNIVMEASTKPACSPGDGSSNHSNPNPINMFGPDHVLLRRGGSGERTSVIESTIHSVVANINSSSNSSRSSSANDDDGDDASAAKDEEENEIADEEDGLDHHNNHHRHSRSRHLPSSDSDQVPVPASSRVLATDCDRRSIAGGSGGGQMAQKGALTETGKLERRTRRMRGRRTEGETGDGAKDVVLKVGRGKEERGGGQTRLPMKLRGTVQVAREEEAVNDERFFYP